MLQGTAECQTNAVSSKDHVRQVHLRTACSSQDNDLYLTVLPDDNSINPESPTAVSSKSDIVTSATTITSFNNHTMSTSITIGHVAENTFATRSGHQKVDEKESTASTNKVNMHASIVSQPGG